MPSLPIAILGLDPPESQALAARLNTPCIIHDTLPDYRLDADGQLLIERPHSIALTPVRAVVYHGIFANDFDLITALAMWSGPCLPNANAMLDARLKLPCLARALRLTAFPGPPRGFVPPHGALRVPRDSVAKWGNWHCGENKQRLAPNETYTADDEPAVIEPFITGTATRVAIIGEQTFQVRLTGDTWLKSIHPDDASLETPDTRLVDDTRHIAQAFGLSVAANDYIVPNDSDPVLLEVNHIPNVTRFDALRNAFIDHAAAWCAGR